MVSVDFISLVPLVELAVDGGLVVGAFCLLVEEHQKCSQFQSNKVTITSVRGVFLFRRTVLIVRRKDAEPPVSSTTHMLLKRRVDNTEEK